MRNNIVFEHKNKLYGAYSLRVNYNKTLAIALLITITAISLIAGFPKIIQSFNKKIEEVKIPVEIVNTIDFTQLSSPIDNIEKPSSPPPSPPIKKEIIQITQPTESNPTAVDKVIPEQQKDNLSQTNTAMQSTESSDKGSTIPKEEDNGINKQNDDTPFKIVDIMPEFPGGQKELYKFLANNIKYPSIEYSNGIAGTSVVTFIVEKDGNISDIKIINGVSNGAGCDNEAMRVVQLMPKWKPGKQNGHPVRVWFCLPIKFLLN